mmetsp:Transcript_15033/g.17412  ORF Transcript_15033/g.17412 Transcript_15033/m.17412 type:complete len:474 (-) Transcript_15033:278-1699(-)
MVATRSAARKRTSGEVNATTSESHNNNIINSEPSLQPQTKRQRTSSVTATTTTTTTLNKKARALKPVASNVKKQTSSKPTKAVAATKPKARAKTKTKSNVRQTKTTTNSSSSSSSSNNDEVLHQRKSHRKKQGERVVGKAAAATAVVTSADAKSSTKSAAKKSINKNSDIPTSGFVKRLRTKKISRLSGNQNGSSEDIDARDRNDPASVTDYVQDMYEHFRNKEEVQRLYIGPAQDGRKQMHINENMRCILVDWLIEVHYKFKLFPETLYLTVNILDRFLSETMESISKRDLQLVGVTSLLISSKYEEMYIPELRDLTYICDGAYTETKILHMEENILKTLKYNVTVPTPHTFLVRFLKAAHADKLMSQIANFILDGTLCSLEHLTCLWRPSQLAAAAVLIARRAVGKLNWSPTLIKYALYDEEDVIRVARSVLKAKNKLDRNRELLALQKKYSKNKYGKVSHYKFASIEDPF